MQTKLSSAEFSILVRDAGLSIAAQSKWDVRRRFDEWAAIVDHPKRMAPLRIIVRALASAGVRAGMDLTLDGDEVAFTHHWHLIVARKSQP